MNGIGPHWALSIKMKSPSQWWIAQTQLGFRCAATTETGVNTQSTPLFEVNRGIPWEIEMIK